MKFSMFLSVAALLVVNSTAFADSVDCSQIYGKGVQCEKVACNELQKTFLGDWSGPFQSYSQELSSKNSNVFRPFQNTVKYSSDDCLRNSENGDSFIVGHRTDEYPTFKELKSQTKVGLLITGNHSDGTPFLTTIDGDGVNSYKLLYKNSLAILTAWELTIPASDQSPEMRFTTIDGRDFTDTLHQKRNVVVTMSIGPKERPVWEGVVSSGTHTQRP